ncbi:DnaJ domain-containing protein [Natranaerobius trueperi]|uniref:Molecular chaperone DnaJ n=1 Tax=Natranaerobius trueperi TaxID=759412 RepID=A0A226BWL9_9FIRM|nr:DnaJ domain-containing protein [Natranaerobius trueperi]OWZ83403.1 molecular chaperone DnaJ [Natranaerobius trueperi]
MKLIKKTIGKIVYGTTQIISKLFDALISFIEITVSLVKSAMSLFFGFLMVGGCFLVLIMLGPLTFTLLTEPNLLLFIIFIIIYPLLGTILLAYIKYFKYMVTEYLFDLSNHLINDKNRRFNSFIEYGEEYKRKEYAKKEKERRERQYQQQKEWEEKFKRWQQYSGDRQYNWYGQSNYQTYTNPNIDFKKKYEESCDILDISYNANKDEIRKAFRKKAKKYHPDVNDSPDASNLFKKINDAYEFLNDTNIERYRNIE